MIFICYFLSILFFIECWDNERRDNEQTTRRQKSLNNNNSDDSGVDIGGHKGNGTVNNILDLRTNNGHNVNVNSHYYHHQKEMAMMMMATTTTTTASSSSPPSSTSSIKYMAADTNHHPGTIKPQSPIREFHGTKPIGHHDHHQLDLYKHYYYYLMQEPAFASRAAVAVAETYAKLLSTNPSQTTSTTSSNDHHLDSSTMMMMMKNKSPPMLDTKSHHHHNHNHNGKSLSSPTFENNGLYETKRTSPDCSQDGVVGITELRSADTTNGMNMFDRKRISRPLTGKHVRHGTGASPSTLVSLRNMIQQRQKLKEIGKFDCNVLRYGKSSKANKRIKRKHLFTL